MARRTLGRDWLTQHTLLLPTLVLATAFTTAVRASAGTAAEGATLFVSNVGQLYDAVNDATNAGVRIVLAPGEYFLSPTYVNEYGQTISRPNGGRLELQRDMSLYGVTGDRSAVVIDPGSLPDPSFKDPLIPGRTGVIRVGRGTNAIEWLTIAGNRYAAAAIETDLVETDEAGEPVPTAIRIAQVGVSDIARGVDIRNITQKMAGRYLVADVENNDFFRGWEGFRVINFQGANEGKIAVAMTGNRSHANRLGCIIENNRSSSASISVVSDGDLFDDNGLGCQIGGGLMTGAGAADDNSVRFDAYGSTFKNNTRLDFNPNVSGPAFDNYGGLLAVAGDVELAGSPNSASRNTVIIRFWDAIIADNVTTANAGKDFLVFGARCDPDICDLPGELAGTQNESMIQLRGLSTLLEPETIDSEPWDPNGTNTVAVVRFH
jgi:hypothetical protein